MVTTCHLIELGLTRYGEALELQRRLAALRVVERGGDITYHGPGQLVGYPILNLAEHGGDLHSYLRRLERILIETLTSFGLGASRWMGRTGGWGRGRKIASIG